MVTSRLLAVLAGLFAAGLAAGSVAVLQADSQKPPTRTASADRVTISCVAVQATHEGREERLVDRAIQEIEDVVVDKDSRRYDTYRFLWRGNATVAYEEEASLRISERYTLFVTPLSQDRQGRIRVAVRVEEQPDPRARRGRDADEKPKPVVAVRATSMLVPGNHLKLDGLNLDEGKMIIALTVRPAR
jgi:hypothetical protein